MFRSNAIQRKTRLAVGLMAFIVFAFLGAASGGSFSANVRDFGARGNGRTNDTSAFRKAFASGRKDVYIPAGTYLLGPASIVVPSNVWVHGDGESSILKPVKETSVLFSLSEGVRLSQFRVEGEKMRVGGITDGAIVLPKGANRVTIRDLHFLDCDRACIYSDHADDLLIEDCVFRNVGIATLLVFSNRLKIRGNSIFDCRLHGIQFWGNWEWKSKKSEDIIITGNYVLNGGGGAIWGTGAKRVVISNNIVDGSTDVGIDLEWSQDSVISGNTVRNFENGGISLFFACERVAIAGNTVINDRPVADPKAPWWARAGIWLTCPNRETFKADMGHRDVSITGNVIYCAPGDRRGIWIGTESDNIALGNNVLRGGGIWTGGGTAPLQTAKDGTVIRSEENADR